MLVIMDAIGCWAHLDCENLFDSTTDAMQIAMLIEMETP